jgi:type IV secretory pathway VirD2 relaxase
MADFHVVPGFEDIWRPPVRVRRVRPEAVLGRADMQPRARLARLAARAPEVMVKITGRPRDGAHLRAHLDYISRNGELALEDQDGVALRGREEVREASSDWAALADLDAGRRANSPMSVSIVLSMPRETDPIAMRDAAAEFARSAFGGRFDYLMALHTDVDHPHVHLSVRALGDGGERLNPRKADLAAWRERFAEALRDRGIEAEATPRRSRGVTRKPERTALRRIGDRQREGRGLLAAVERSAWQEAGRAAMARDRDAPRPWEAAMRERQARLRGLYLAQAAVLCRSPDEEDRALGAAVRSFVEAMPAVESRRQRHVGDLMRHAGDTLSPARRPSRVR